MYVWFKKHEGFVTARLMDIVGKNRPATEISSNGVRWFKVTLQDKDHQSLIDTLDKVWPNWSDGDILLERQKAEAA